MALEKTQLLKILPTLTKQQIAQHIIKASKGEAQSEESVDILKYLRLEVEQRLPAYISGMEDSPITTADLRFYYKEIAKILDYKQKNIGARAGRLALIIYNVLNPSETTIKSKTGLGIKAKAKNAKIAVLGGNSDDPLQLQQDKLRTLAKQTVKDKSSKLLRSARKKNVAGIAASGVAGLFGLDKYSDRIEEYFENKYAKKDTVEDKLDQLLESQKENEKEELQQLENLAESESLKKGAIDKIADKNTEVSRISQELAKRLSVDEKYLKDFKNFDNSNLFLESLLNSKVDISDDLKEKIQKSLAFNSDLEDDNEFDSHKSKDRGNIPHVERPDVSDFQEFASKLENLIQPQALQSDYTEKSGEILTEALPSISTATQQTSENVDKVDDELNKGFTELGKNIKSVEEGTDRIASLIEKQISMQRMAQDNGSNSISRSGEGSDSKDEPGLDDVLDFFDRGKNRSKTLPKRGKVRSGRLGRFASKVLSPLGGLASTGSSALLSKGAKLAGKAALPLAAIMSAYDAYQGFDKDKADALGFNGDTTKGKANSSISSVLSGLTLGLVGEDTIAEGIKFQDQLQDSIVEAIGGKDSPLGQVVDKLINPFDSLMDGIDNISSWFSDDKKEKEKEEAQAKAEQSAKAKSTLKEESKQINEKELVEKVLEVQNPNKQFQSFTDHLFDSPGAKKVWDSLLDRQNILDSVMAPVSSAIGGVLDSVNMMFGGKPEITPSMTGNLSSGGNSSNLPQISGAGNLGSVNIGQYGGSALGDGDIGTSQSIGKFGDVQALLQYGMSFIGKVKYNLGSKDPTSGKCDCSGFVKYLFTTVWGVKGMPDGAAYQFTWKKGRVINDISQLQPGDLYFMNSPASFAADRPLGISHVGIYAGDGKLLHCSSSANGVNLMPLSNYYKKWFVGAKRLTEEGGTAGVTSAQAENSPTMTMPSSNPTSETGGVMPIGGSSGALSDPSNPNSITGGKEPDGSKVENNPSAIPYSKLSNANADKNASESGLKARDAFIRQSMEAGVSKESIAVMLGQLDHESAGFKSTQENLNYTSADRIRKVFGKSLNGVDPNTLVNNPEALANVVYGKKNGNRGGSDGWNYRGRGLVQLTGRGNYEAASKAIGVDLVSNPELAADPEVSAKIAMWWHKEKVGHNATIAEATRKINGSAMKGYEDRVARTQSWMNGRLDQEIAKIQGEVVTPEKSETATPTELATYKPSNQVQGIATPSENSLIDVNRGRGIQSPTGLLGSVAQTVQSLPMTERVARPPTRMEELQQTSSLVAQGSHSAPVAASLPSFNPSANSEIKWKDWIEDSSLTAFQRLINGGLG